jgi:protein CWC15
MKMTLPHSWLNSPRSSKNARLAAEQADSASQDRTAEIALGNPLLNLQAALGQTPDSPSARSTSTAATGFAVKRRWDDDLIFKNQAVGQDDKPKKEFVNDILRSEFHRKFMSK